VAILNGGSKTNAESKRSKNNTNGESAVSRSEQKKNSKGVFYDTQETERYTDAAERTGVQLELTRRALHWMVAGADPFKTGLPPASLLLDVGVGAGACAAEVHSAIPGATVVGLDQSIPMLALGRSLGRVRNGVCWDFAHLGLPLRASHSFDGALSVSAIQWLCLHGDDNDDAPARTFFASLVGCLAPGARFVAQFFPRTPVL
jgi:hypothetical protein